MSRRMFCPGRLLFGTVHAALILPKCRSATVASQKLYFHTLPADANTKHLVLLVSHSQGEAVPLAAGEELLIGYQGGYTPLEAFLKFGFVADEWWPDQSGKQP